MSFVYPSAHRSDQVDVYHGVAVPDPYRWLEEPGSPATVAFVEAQDALARDHLRALPTRRGLAERIAELWRVERTGLPTSKAATTVWTSGDGIADQPIFVVERADGSRATLLDPNEMSEDGAVAVVGWSLSPDGATLAYSVSESGRDWQQIRFRDIATARDHDDVLAHVKFTSLAWHDGGIFYERFPAVDEASVATVNDPSVCFHRLGTDQADDPVVFHNEVDPDLGYSTAVTDDHRYVVLTEWRGTSSRAGFLYRPLNEPGTGWSRLIPLDEAVYTFIGHHDGRFWFRTDRDHPNGSIVAIRPDDGQVDTVVPAGEHPITHGLLAAGRLFVAHLVDAAHRLTSLALDGSSGTQIDLPATGTISGLSGAIDDDRVYLCFESFTHPPTAYRISGHGVEALTGENAATSNLVVERRSATSSDGAEVGMFVLRDPATPLPAPTELYGYGGFSIDLTPTYDPARLAFAEAGGVAVVANLRGGTELGEEWHRQGMLGAKQQVFDDFIACGESLIETDHTTTDRLGIRGRSNGGLLTAAVVLQRPDLFGAVVSQVPVTDMLRYQHFTAGRHWTVEYGDAADPDAFAWLLAYSPVHTVQPGVDYPPILITTGETDDRVVPMHSYKFGAALQHAAGGTSARPLLIRVDRRAGHGLGKPISKLIDESADVYGFLLHHLGATDS